MMATGYCVKCKQKGQTIKDPKEVTTKNGRKMLKGTCAKCGCNMCAFIKG
jgi:hypothetical protein